MSQPQLFEITEPAHTNVSQTGRHTLQSRRSTYWRATPTPYSFTCRAWKCPGLLRCVFWVNSEITSGQNRSSTGTPLSSSIVLPLLNTSSKPRRTVDTHTRMLPYANDISNRCDSIRVCQAYFIGMVNPT